MCRFVFNCMCASSGFPGRQINDACAISSQLSLILASSQFSFILVVWYYTFTLFSIYAFYAIVLKTLLLIVLNNDNNTRIISILFHTTTIHIVLKCFLCSCLLIISHLLLIVLNSRNIPFVLNEYNASFPARLTFFDYTKKVTPPSTLLGEFLGCFGPRWTKITFTLPHFYPARIISGHFIFIIDKA